MKEINPLILLIAMLIILLMLVLSIYYAFQNQKEPLYTLHKFKDGTIDYCRPPEIWGSRYNYEDCCSGLIHTMATDVIEYGVAVINCSGIDNTHK